MAASHIILAVVCTAGHDVILALAYFHQQLQRIVLQVMEPVVDSSRYFALRIEDPVSKRHAFIGIGFRCVPASASSRISTDQGLTSCWHAPSG